MADNSVLITGCGWVTPSCAGSIREVLACAGAEWESRSGSSITVDPKSFREIPPDLLTGHAELPKELQRDRGALMTAVALGRACRDASLELASFDGERVGLVLGCGLAGQLGMIGFADEVREKSPRFVSPINFPKTVGNYIAGALARSFGVRGPNMTLANGTASGLDAIIEACRLITVGSADLVFAGATEQLTPELAGGLSETGETLSEGACLFVLERSSHAAGRSAAPLATVTEWGHLAENVDSSDRKIVSLAGRREGGAIHIEHWIGNCLGTASAAAVAAAIGAGSGHNVPRIDPADVNSVLVGPVAVEQLRNSNGNIPATIIAYGDGVEQAGIAIDVSGKPSRH